MFPIFRIANQVGVKTHGGQFYFQFVMKDLGGFGGFGGLDISARNDCRRLDGRSGLRFIRLFSTLDEDMVSDGVPGVVDADEEQEHGGGGDRE